MFAIAADYLMGWAMACADGASKQRAEWPPHPDRAFMALAAAWFETGCDEAEGIALRWLESLDPPSLSASGCGTRSAVVAYVPVNDTANPVEDEKKRKLAMDIQGLSIGRRRRARSFPLAVPRNPIMHFVWPVELRAECRDALAALCRKVTSIGHSASLVRLWIDEAPPAVNWVPGDAPSAIRLRVTGGGRLRYLEERMNKKAVEAHATMKMALTQASGRAKAEMVRQINERFPLEPVSLRPEPGLWHSYIPPRCEAPQEEPVVRSLFDDRLVVLALAGQRMGLQTTLQLTTALRGALFSGCGIPLPEWVSGHAAGGTPTREPHLALLPLAFTGARHADGRLMGIALALPRSTSATEGARVLAPWLREVDGSPREHRLFNGRALACTAALESRETPPVTLEVRRWVGPAKRWATVTPIALDRHAGGRDVWESATEVVALACERIGLPRPVEILLHPNSLVEGVPPSRSFVPIVRKRNGGPLAHTHAVLTFSRDVLGPVVLGAGRFRGYGFCKPLRRPGAADG